MSRATPRVSGLKPLRTRGVYVVFVTLERDMAELRRRRPVSWTIPSSARPGDMVIVYKPGATAGWTGVRKPPYERFVAAAVVYGLPKRRGRGVFNATLAEAQIFPAAVPRRVVTEAFPEWTWLRSMRGMLGSRVPAELESDFVALIDRLAFARSAKTKRRART